MTEQHSGAVVVAVRVRREGEHKTIDVGSGRGERQSLLLLLLLAVAAGAPRLVHDARRHVAVQVQVEDVARVGAGARERSHLTDHGEDRGKGGVPPSWGREGDVEDGACVDDLVDRLE